jgi:hypothetical protein
VVQDGIYRLGSSQQARAPRTAALWESTVAPEQRGQAAAAAEQIIMQVAASKSSFGAAI